MWVIISTWGTDGATSKGYGLAKKKSVSYPSNGYEIVTLTH